MKEQPKNLTELFHSISDVRGKVISNEIDIPQAESSNNAAGKMIKIAALQVSFLTAEEAKKVDILQ